MKSYSSGKYGMLLTLLLFIFATASTVPLKSQSGMAKDTDAGVVMMHQPESTPVPRSLSLNPYRNVNWQSFQHYRSNFHTHTTYSDGIFHPHEVVDLYHNAGYKILSITDHNLITWPWTGFSLLDSSYQDRDPQLLGMLAVMGNELSASHHTGSLINAIPGDGSNFMAALDSIALVNGLGILYHPGRYWDIDSVYAPNQLHSPEWYRDLFDTFPGLAGLEVYNQGDRHPHDRVLWDELLNRMMPHRPVWGYSNDDMHVHSQLYKNYNFMLMPALDINDLKTCMEEGAFLFAYEPAGNGNQHVPVIDSIVVDKTNRSIHIHGHNYKAIEWISGVDGSGGTRTSRVINTGNTFSYNSFFEPYVRAVLINDDGRTYTQPFGFDTIPPPKTDSIHTTGVICEGADSVNMYVADDGLTETFHWQLPQGAVIISGLNTNNIIADFSNVTQAGFVYVWKTNASGSSDTTSKLITINPLPDKPVVTRLGAQLLSSAALGNQWHDQNGKIPGANGQAFTPTISGSFHVIVTLKGCSSPPSDTISIIVGTEEYMNPGMAIYPNPADNRIYIETGKQNHGPLYISIRTTDGRLLFLKEIPASDNPVIEVDLSAVSAGMHVLQISAEKFSAVQRLVVIR